MYERTVRRTAEETAATRAALVDAALITFARDGIDGATLAGIAGAAGLTRGALYHHFPDKDALLAAVLGEMWDVVAGPVWTELDAPGTPLARRLEAFAIAWLAALHGDRRFTALTTVCLHAGAGPGSVAENSVAENSVAEKAVAEKAAGFRTWYDRLLAALTRDDADLRGDPGAAAAHLLAWLTGTALLAGHDPALVPPADATGVRPVLEGILP